MIQSPDPHARRNAAILVLGFTFLGTVSYFALDRFITDLRELAQVDPELAVEHASLAIKVLALTLGGTLAGLAAWLVHFSLGIARTGRFPPPGTDLIRETRILAGAQARARARLGFVLAVVIAAAAVALPTYLWHITGLLARP
ncbi:MAG: hypothetical protein PVG79_03670 [Gemmatimonadales bacterium]